MNGDRNRRLTNLLADESGQVLQWVAISMVGLIGLCGFSIDAGRAYVAHSSLQNSTNAAALAAAGLVYDTDSTNSVSSTANLYSASAGEKNVS